ncbi:MAG: DUF2062 domain-containing protein [Cyclobacteriaceae bacterium]|nr:DUF2062 domain-containing protein [Cyclobacteriaceae bacterium]
MIHKPLKKLWQLIIKALKQGITPHKLAITIAAGAVIALFPVYGLTTLLCFAVAIPFRLNIIVIQAVNYLMTPFQLLFLVPILQGGIWMFGLKKIVFDLSELTVRFKEDFFGLFSEIGAVLLGGIAFWFLVAVPTFIFLFYICRLILTRFIDPYKSESAETF